MDEGCSIHLSNPFESKKSTECISILVVDDDLTCLAILSSILRKFKYRVVAVKHPTDALRTLRINGGGFDLVISDVHMPDMNGFQLQQAIAQEFQIPVILTSADNNECIASKGSVCGAACFILKPVKPDDLKDLWQMATMNKGTQVEIIRGEHSVELSNSTTMTTATSSSAVTTNKNKKRKGKSNEVCDGKQGESCSPFPTLKKPKIVWTNALHNRFLEALRNIGLDRAVPKRILELMDVPGLTRENVASHLQKYRMFLRRVTDASFRMQHNVDGPSLNRNPETNLGSLSASSSTNTSLTLFNQPSTPLQDLEPSSYTSIVKPTIGNLSWLPPQNDLQAYQWSNNYYENLIHSVPIPSHDSSLPLADFSGFLRACLDTPGPRNYIFGNKQSVAGLGQPDDHHDFDSPGDSFSAMASYSVHMPQYDNLTTFADPRNFLNEVGGTIAANSNNCDGLTNLDTILQSYDAVGNQQSSNPFSHISQQLADSCQLSKALIPPSNKEPVCESSTRSLRFGSASQINIIPQSQVEQLEEEFLNSLIAPSEEAPTLTGILPKRT